MASWIFIILIYLLIIIGLPYLAYRLSKNRGKKTLGIILASITFIIVTFPITSVLIEDYWFFKSDVTKTLVKHEFYLTDDFEIVEHEISGLMDYYEYFRIQISNEDKIALINKIKNADNFEDRTIETDKPIDEEDAKVLPRYSNDQSEVYTWNYLTEKDYIFKYYKPRPRGETPIDETISISINKKELKYEIILD
ncbi:hypothetical protein ABWH96_06585 [Marivirga tractuosa]|uniref:hypothetical protein n=1 Tax=Marivirga tractuosa TaxID=1006 RepID=UPI0035CF1C6A